MCNSDTGLPMRGVCPTQEEGSWPGRHSLRGRASEDDLTGPQRKPCSRAEMTIEQALTAE